MLGHFVHDRCGASQDIPSVRHREGGYVCAWCEYPVLEGQVQRAVHQELARRDADRVAGAKAAKARVGR